jgi:hypothetical protein
VLYYDADTKKDNFKGQDVVLVLKCNRWVPQNTVIIVEVVYIIARQ